MEKCEKQANDEYLKKVVETTDSHFRKHKKKKMGLNELDKLCEA